METLSLSNAQKVDLSFLKRQLDNLERADDDYQQHPQAITEIIGSDDVEQVEQEDTDLYLHLQKVMTFHNSIQGFINREEYSRNWIA